MTERSLRPFFAVRSTEPSFEVTVDNTSVATALESTATFRTWDGPLSHSIRLASMADADYYMVVGDSNIVATSSGGLLMLGGTVEIQTPMDPRDTHIAFKSSTDVTINVTLGYGQ